MIITTTNSLDGLNIEKYLGLVSANQVIGANIISEFFASFTDVFGGNSGAIQGKLDILYSQVSKLIEEKAIEKGANAVIGFRIEFDEISGKGKSMYMVTAIGTAVICKEDKSLKKYEIFRKIHELKLFLNENLISPDEYEREVSFIKNQYKNEVETESKKIKEEEEKLQQIKEAKEKQKEKEAEELRKLKELTGGNIDDLIIKKSLYGFNVDDAILIKDSGECTTIDGFTKDNKVVCRINDEFMIFDFNDIRLV